MTAPITVTVTVTVTVNGVPREIAAATTVAALLADLVGPCRSGVAVAVNGVVVPGSRADQILAGGDEVEVLTAIRGG